MVYLSVRRESVLTLLSKRRQAVVEPIESVENTALSFAKEVNEVIKPAKLVEFTDLMSINTMEVFCLKDIMNVIWDFV
jgi:hypothetical protein